MPSDLALLKPTVTLNNLNGSNNQESKNYLLSVLFISAELTHKIGKICCLEYMNTA